MRFKKAQAEGIYWVIISILLASAVLLTFGWHVSSVASNSLPQKQFVSRDVALLTNIVSSSPGNIYYWYEPFPIMQTDLSKFSYKYEENRFKVLEGNIETTYPYGENILLKNTRRSLEKPIKLEMQKSGNSFEFGKGFSPAYYAYAYKKPIGFSPNVVLVSSLTHNPTTGEEYVSGDSFLQYSSAVKAKNNPKLGNVSVKTAFLLLAQEPGDIIVALKKVDNEEIKIYGSYEEIEETRYMASLIAAKLADLNTFVPIIPVESSKKIIVITAGSKFLKEKGDSLVFAISSALENE